MNGFEIFLCVLAGIILFFVLILSVPIHVNMSYRDKVYLKIRYGFISLNILPLGPKKPKKPKEKKPKEEKPEEEKEEKEEKPKEKKPNPIVEMAKANGYDGMMEVLGNLGSVLMKYGGKLTRSIKFNDIEIYATIGTGDAASTAIEYGKACEKIFPLAGFICANNKVKRYDIDISPDFLATHKEYEFNLDFHMVLRKIINATFGMVGRLVVKVLLKFIMNGKKKDKETPEAEQSKTKK